MLIAGLYVEASLECIRASDARQLWRDELDQFEKAYADFEKVWNTRHREVVEGQHIVNGMTGKDTHPVRVKAPVLRWLIKSPSTNLNQK